MLKCTLNPEKAQVESDLKLNAATLAVTETVWERDPLCPQNLFWWRGNREITGDNCHILLQSVWKINCFTFCWENLSHIITVVFDRVISDMYHMAAEFRNQSRGKVVWLIGHGHFGHWEISCRVWVSIERAAVAGWLVAWGPCVRCPGFDSQLWWWKEEHLTIIAIALHQQPCMVATFTKKRRHHLSQGSDQCTKEWELTHWSQGEYERLSYV